MPRLSSSDDNAAAVARRFGVTIKTLRLYEGLGLIAPARTSAGWRTYGPQDLARLHTVLSLKQMGLPLAAITVLIRDRGTDVSRLLALQEEVLLAQRSGLEQALILVRAARAQVEAGHDLDADDLARLVQQTATARLAWSPQLQALAERTFSADQLKSLESAAPAVDDTAWARVYADIDAFPPDADPASEEGLAIGRRAVRLIQDYTRGDPQMWNAAARFWRGGLDDPEIKGDLPMQESHWSFLSSAMGELRRRGELRP